MAEKAICLCSPGTRPRYRAVTPSLLATRATVLTSPRPLSPAPPSPATWSRTWHGVTNIISLTTREACLGGVQGEGDHVGNTGGRASRQKLRTEAGGSLEYVIWSELY